MLVQDFRVLIYIINEIIAKVITIMIFSLLLPIKLKLFHF